MQRLIVARRALLTLALVSIVWAVFVALAGGFRINIAGVYLSSRHITNPLVIALLAACSAVALSRRRIPADDLRWLGSRVTFAYRITAAQWWARWINLASIAACGGASLLLYDWTRARPLWVDEEMIALNIRDRSLLGLAGPTWLDQSAPLGWLGTQRIAAVLLGTDEIALRFVPVLFGVAAVAAAAWVGRRWMTSIGAAALVVLCSLGQWVFHYSLELKHYSADVLFGLMLPALAAWAMEGDEPHRRLRRAAIWWGVAALGQWWANGALFVTPACAVVLWIMLWRSDGWRSAIWFSVCGVGWLASFGLHYLLALRFTLASDFLRDYWAIGLPPAAGGAVATARWLAEHTAPFADRPGGTDLAILFWVTAACGFLSTFTRTYRPLWIFATVPVSAYVLAAVRLVPLYERQSLWAVPALYVGIALCGDAGVRWARHGYEHVRPVRVAAAAIMVGAVAWVGLDIVGRTSREIRDRDPNSNHALDDRTAVRWLVGEARADDAVLTTALGLPAVWWYGSVPVSSPTSAAALPNGSPIFEVLYHLPGSTCDDGALRYALRSHRRVFVYVGFAFDAAKQGFRDLLAQELEPLGHMTEMRRFAANDRVEVVRVNRAEGGEETHDNGADHSTHPNGCVSVRRATRW